MEGLVEPEAGEEAEPGVVNSVPAVGEGDLHSTEPGGRECHEALTATLERSRRQCHQWSTSPGVPSLGQVGASGLLGPLGPAGAGKQRSGPPPTPKLFGPPQCLQCPSWGCSHPARKTGCWR